MDARVILEVDNPERVFEKIAARVSARLGEAFEVLGGDERPVACERESRPPGLSLWVGDCGRLRTTAVEEGPVGRPAATTGERWWRLAPLGGEGSRGLLAHRMVLESRLAAFAVAAAVQLGEGLEGAPLPELDRPTAQQLRALGRRAGEARRGEPLDWAVERVVADLYDWPVSELVSLQQRFRSEGPR